MPQPSATISPSYDSGSVDLTWSITDAPISALKSIKSLVNESSSNSAIVETSHPIFELVNNESTLIKKITMGTNLLELGKSHYVQLEFLYNNNTKIRSNALFLINKKVPDAPLIALTTIVRPEDQGVSININSLYTLNSVSDGFSPITKATVIISKVGGTTATDYQVQEVDIDSYDKWYLVPATNLQNSISYEIAIKLNNSLGESALSNTLVFQPKDTPSLIGNVRAYSLLSDQKRKSQLQADELGSIVLYWSAPDDYNTLISNNRRVLKYIISEQLYVESVVNGVPTMVPSGPPTLIDLNVPQHVVGAHSTASFELPLAAPETIGGVNFRYKYVVEGSPERLGKQFRYTVLANNSNGDGPISSLSPSVYAFKAANSQPFLLQHLYDISTVTATPIDIFSGKMSIKIEAGTLAALNGGIGFSQDSDQFTWPTTSGFFIPKDENLRLIVIKESDQSTVFDQMVLFKQTVTRTGTSPNYTYTPTSEYNLDFDAATQSGQNLNNILQLGIKYRFNVLRVNKNPAILADSFASPESSKLRTKFRSPNAVSKIQSYAVYDDLTPVTKEGSSAIRLLFEQVSNSDLGGCEVFIPTGNDKPDILYTPYQQSLPVLGIPPISHDPSFSGTKEFIIPASVGNSVAQYIRYSVLNTELDIRISANESSPAVSETPFTFPSAVPTAAITKISATTIKVSFNRQAVNNLGGSSSGDVQNRILVIKDEEETVSHETLVQHNAGASYISPTEITLENGSSYTLFIIAERKYNKLAHDSTTNKRFDNVVIRSNYYKETFVVTGQPTQPTNIKLLPSNKSLEVLYDAPNSLSGVLEDSLRFNFYMNSDLSDFPNFTSSPLVLQASVSDLAGSSIATITKAFRTKAESNNRSNVVDLLNDTEYKFAMNVVGTVGGNQLKKINYNHLYTGGKVNLVNVSPVINLVSNLSVPISTVIGSMSAVETVFISDSVPSVQNAVVLGQENSLNITFDKDTSGTVNDLLITIGEEDALGSDGLPVPTFDTRSLRNVGGGTSSGLFNMETWASANPSQVATNAPDFSKYNFRRVNFSGQFKYTLDIPNLVNGRTYNVMIRFIKNVNGNDVFGPASIIARAPEAPPTAVLNPTFSVDNLKINAAWDAPANSGGAGIGSNSSLKYKIVLLSNSDVQISEFITPLRSISIVTGLTNGTDYKVIIAALYTKASDNSDVIGPPTQANQASGNLIRPGPAPVGPVLSVIVGAASNDIRGSLILPQSSETNLYSVARYDVYIRHKTVHANKVLLQSFSATGTSVNGLAGTVNPLNAGSTLSLGPYFTIPAGVSPNTFVHSKPLNGFTYELVVETIPNYTYAQAAAAKVADATPYGSLIIQSATVKTGTSGKVYTVVANLNGSGLINTIIGLGKSVGSNSVLLQNLSGAGLPAITVSGSLDNVSNFVAANQLATFDLPFLASSSAVSDLVVVVVTQLSSDTFIHPASGSFFQN
jgi:hypothetical protein